MHEMGHSFCGLWDEYLYDNARTSTFSWGERNCVKDTKSFLGFGDATQVGCSTYNDFHRPSFTSIMDKSTAKLFNVVSCGYCLQFLNESKQSVALLRRYFEECMAYNTIKPGAECIRDGDCPAGKKCVNQRCVVG